MRIETDILGGAIAEKGFRKKTWDTHNLTQNQGVQFFTDLLKK